MTSICAGLFSSPRAPPVAWMEPKAEGSFLPSASHSSNHMEAPPRPQPAHFQVISAEGEVV